MPELPEVETTVRELNQKVLNRTFVDVWTDAPGMIKKPENFNDFKKNLLGRKILKARRRAKNIILELSGGKALLIHQKLTGHLLYGKLTRAGKGWKPADAGTALADNRNRYLHLVMPLDDGSHLALSDLRKFAKIELWEADELRESKEMKSLGCEPMEPDFTFERFKSCLKGKRGKIKQILMDQSAVAGIGNIYSDEILWKARIHPCRLLPDLSEKELKAIHENIKPILSRAIKKRGTTVVSNVEEYRDLAGRAGEFQNDLNVYRKEGKKCPVCGGIVEKIKVAGRSWHYCPKCQKL